MKTSPIRRWKAGYVSTLLVLATGSVLTLLTVYAYRRSTLTMQTQAKVQLGLDYSEKEEAILRSIVSITPNRAMRAMFSDSNSSTTVSNPLRWQNIFTEALVLANARTSISPELVTSLNVTGLNTGNAGDSALADPSRIFMAIPSDTGYVSPGINRSLGTGYPPPLTSGDSTTSTRDALYPIISASKTYGTLAQSGVGLPVATYPNFNLLKYPQINFGYAKPGDNFVAKRNWWAFSLDVADHDDNITMIARPKRNFVLSIYEIPSQLAISASSFMSLGQFASGSAWQNVTITGGIFAGKAEVLGNTDIDSLSSRRGMTLSSDATLGGQSFAESPFKAGVREAYQVTTGQFFPASLASESGRVAFVPINRGADFFDRFAHTAESSVLSTTSWNSYSIGANQCAMRLDVTSVESSTNNMPVVLRFSYLLSNGTRVTREMPQKTGILAPLPPGYVWRANEEKLPTTTGKYDFGSQIVDVAYGFGSKFYFKRGVTGPITFNNATFGDPFVSQPKEGYSCPSAPFEIKSLSSGQKCVAVYPERLSAFLATIGGAVVGPSPGVAPVAGYPYNNSLVINVDYSTTGLNNAPKYKPNIPCTANDYGVILKECGNLSSFTKGFSLVTNLRLYIGDDFNVTVGTPPPGYTPSGTFYPPCSLFAPEKRYGVDVDPFSVILGGQVGSLASESVSTAVRPLDSKTMSGTELAAANITVNLRPITHPAELPPITMMNWLVVLEERRKEFY